jgi:hypothetical protein
MKRRRKKKSESLTVAVHAFNEKTDKTEKVGDIIYENGKVRVSDPENYTLATILHNSVTHPSEGRGVRADREPELFMWLLCTEYNGSYAHCDRPIVNKRRISCKELADRFAPPNE